MVCCFVVSFANFRRFNQLSSGYYCDVSGQRSAERWFGFGTVGVSVVHSGGVLVTVISCHSVRNVPINYILHTLLFLNQCKYLVGVFGVILTAGFCVFPLIPSVSLLPLGSQATAAPPAVIGVGRFLNPNDMATPLVVVAFWCAFLPPPSAIGYTLLWSSFFVKSLFFFLDLFLDKIFLTLNLPDLASFELHCPINSSRLFGSST